MGSAKLAMVGWAGQGVATPLQGSVVTRVVEHAFRGHACGKDHYWATGKARAVAPAFWAHDVEQNTALGDSNEFQFV